MLVSLVSLSLVSLSFRIHTYKHACHEQSSLSCHCVSLVLVCDSSDVCTRGVILPNLVPVSALAHVSVDAPAPALCCEQGREPARRHGIGMCQDVRLSRVPEWLGRVA